MGRKESHGIGTPSDKPIACSMSCDWHVTTHCFGMIRCHLLVLKTSLVNYSVSIKFGESALSIDKFKFGSLNS